MVTTALDIAIKRHQASRIIIADHVDCAAYGGSSAHEDMAAEEDFHHEKLREAARVITSLYDGLEVMLLYQGWRTVEMIDFRSETGW